MLKIGDFSKFSQVSIKTLRYYDEIGLLKPIKVDELTGYRYYSAEQLPLLNKIIGFKELGLTLEDILKILTESLPADDVIKLLKAKRRTTLDLLRREEARLKKMEEWLRKIEKEGNMPKYDVVVKKVEALTIASVRDTLGSYSEVGKLYGELFAFIGSKRIKPMGPPLSIYHDHEYKDKDADVEAGIPVAAGTAGSDKVKVQTLPVIEQAACLIHKGPYENFNQAYQSLMSWIEENGYSIEGPNREVYLKGPGQFIKGNPNDYITEIQVPVKKK
jgi:effector-binding domain-containing protein